MNNSSALSLLLSILILSTFLTITSSPLSLTSILFAASDNGNGEGRDNGNNENNNDDNSDDNNSDNDNDNDNDNDKRQ
ncbi:MAG TPA: hypothetical protein VFX75_02385 [Nitrososphaeraceae archaeon]|nr:hypothetical protein [Nitrososphaeraceae archaeon]